VRGLEAERVAGASPGSSMVLKRCTSRLRSGLLCRLPRGSVSVCRWANMSWALGSTPRGASGPGGGATVGGGLAKEAGPCVSACFP